MNNTNQQLAMIIWVVNVAIFGLLVWFVYTCLVQPPAPGLPSYVPDAGELPQVSPPATWITWNPSQKASDTARNVDAPAFRVLHVADWNRREPIGMPALKPPPVERPPDPQLTREQLLAMAVNDLRANLTIHFIAAPNEVLVELTKIKPNELITVVPVDSPRASLYYSDLSELRFPMALLEIHADGIKVRYTFTHKNQTEEFEIDFPRVAEVNNPWGLGGQIVGSAPMPSNGTRSGTSFRDPNGPGSGAANPRNPGVGSAANSTPAVPSNPPPSDSIAESYEAGDGVWVIADKEVVEVRDNMDKMISDLNPRSVWDPETRRYQGIQVQNVPESSLAYQRGFRQGDTVISINGTPVNSVNDVKNYVRRNKNLPQYVVVYVRRGEQQTRTFRVPQNNK